MTSPDFSRATWRKSSHSGAGNGGGQCVEVAFAPGAAAFRDSKNPDLAQLAVPATAYQRFLAEIKTGAYDLA
jgi:hypothetical protein